MERAYMNHTRDKSGMPGKAYSQNAANYTIKVTLNPSTRELNGVDSIEYVNNSKDTLTYLVFKLYPNLYKTDAMRNMQIAEEDLGKGVQIKSLTLDNSNIDGKRLIIKGTNMLLKGITVLPGQTLHININYSYILNKGSFIRTGQVDSGSFFIAYFFPRIAVYDDLDGWSEYPYVGKEEFYNDYGNFQVEIAVPGNYQVWATGNLKNIHDVYPPLIADRIRRAETIDSITDIITESDLKMIPTSKADSCNTWIFEASGVTDFAFAVSNHYVWKASSVLVDSATKRRTRIDAVFNPEHKAYLPVINYARKAVELISHFFPKIPFPYSHETIFDGRDAMEYPMMVNNLPFENEKDAIELTTHEVFHSIFPFYVANNETKYSFMDEGWATLSEFMLYPLVNSAVPADYDISPVNTVAGTDEDMPIITPTPQLYGKARFADKDLKPALAFWYLKEMLGYEVFVKALRVYITRWGGKHPSPFDFFSSINAGSGVNLNWFWKNWFFEKNVPDLAINKVTHNELNYSVLISSPGTLATPVHLNIIYKNGKKDTLSRDISCWSNGRKPVTIKFRARMQVKEIILGDAYDVDINPVNNRWKNLQYPNKDFSNNH
ncbi:MAG: M1 family metallopeptidase [Chitinophagaceae bacterium]